MFGAQDAVFSTANDYTKFTKIIVSYSTTENPSEVDLEYNPRFHYHRAVADGFRINGVNGQGRTLFIGKIANPVRADVLCALFESCGKIAKFVLYNDGTYFKFAFIEFENAEEAKFAYQYFHNRNLEGRSINVNFLTPPPPNIAKGDTSKDFHIFVGDISSEVNEELLHEYFVTFGEITDVKIIKDVQTNRPKGYGFVSFAKKDNAEKAMVDMNGRLIGRRPIRTNWASRKQQADNAAGGKPCFDEIYEQTGKNTSVYIGDIAPSVTEDEIRTAFALYGQFLEVRVFKEHGYGFVRFTKKECACRAIVEMNGFVLGGRPLRVSWGRTSQVIADDNNQCRLLSMPLKNTPLIGPNQNNGFSGLANTATYSTMVPGNPYGSPNESPHRGATPHSPQPTLTNGAQQNFVYAPGAHIPKPGSYFPTQAQSMAPASSIAAAGFFNGQCPSFTNNGSFSYQDHTGFFNIPPPPVNMNGAINIHSEWTV
uniref:Nucleolysin TIA-1/TIAR n=1 Tax=Rhabditophanes sp. KR3021 TaxID=114890 RepID=A0AC35TLQ2_9BILA